MLQGILGEIIYFFTSINQNITISMDPVDRIGLIVSIGSLIITIIAIIIALGIYKRQQRTSSVKRMIVILSSFDLLYYSLEKHYKTWKDSQSDSPGQDAQDFWKMINLTETVTNMQELKTLSTVYSKRLINLEVNSLLEFLGDMILISYRGEDLSGKDYNKESVVSSDEFEVQMAALIKKLSRGIGIKVHKSPEKEIVKSYIAGHFFK
jgi:hypothetical protein